MYNGADKDRYRYWEETETIDEVIKENYKLKDALNEQKEIVKILSKEIVNKDYLLACAVERLEFINYEDDHLTNDLIQTIKNQKEGV